MRVRDKVRGCFGEIAGVIGNDGWKGTEFAIATDDGSWTAQYASNLEILNKPDMKITVGHVIDNPTFDFNGLFEITTTDEDGTVRTLYDSAYEDDDIPCELLIEPVTYMVVNEHEGKLRLEVR